MAFRSEAITPAECRRIFFPPVSSCPPGTTCINPQLASSLAALFPVSNTTEGGGNDFLSDPKRNETENKFDIRYDYSITDKDNFFARFSYGNDSNFLPSPFNNILDGGSFQDGYSNNTAEGLAASELHTFRSNLFNEFRFGFNHLQSHRYNLNYNVNVSQQINLSRSTLRAGSWRPAFDRLQRWHD